MVTASGISDDEVGLHMQVSSGPEQTDNPGDGGLVRSLFFAVPVTGHFSG